MDPSIKKKVKNAS